MDAVEVIWWDAEGTVDGWVTPSEVDVERRYVRSVGMKVLDNDDFIILALSSDPHTGYVDSLLKIPQPMVQDVFRLRREGES